MQQAKLTGPAEVLDRSNQSDFRVLRADFTEQIENIRGYPLREEINSWNRLFASIQAKVSQTRATWLNSDERQSPNE
jgi:hypothetical protein